jgi:hypothetical protein
MSVMVSGVAGSRSYDISEQAFVVFAKTLTETIEIAAIEGARASPPPRRPATLAASPR